MKGFTNSSEEALLSNTIEELESEKKGFELRIAYLEHKIKYFKNIKENLQNQNSEEWFKHID